MLGAARRPRDLARRGHTHSEKGETRIVPRFFATNRAMHHLGRVLDEDDRETRHLLCRGGYYFVDMEEYMRFYLGTVRGDEMPRGAVVRDSGTTVFSEFLADSRIKSVVVCVHGFNVELFEAFTWFRILTDTMKSLRKSIVTSLPKAIANTGGATAGTEEPAAETPDQGLSAFIGFSWPSNGNVLSYASDQREAIGSAAAFGSLLLRLKRAGKSINLLCHSMGNFLACHTLAALVDKHSVPHGATKKEIALFKRGERTDSEDVKREKWLIDNYVMLAPDVERRHVTRCAGGKVETKYQGPFYSGLQHLVRKQVNVYSRFDSVLKLSSYEKAPREWAHSIGDAASDMTFGLLDFLKRNPDQRWEKRLGSAPAPLNAAPGFVSVNATELTNRRVGHGDHIDSRPIVARIAKELGI